MSQSSSPWFTKLVQRGQWTCPGLSHLLLHATAGDEAEGHRAAIREDSELVAVQFLCCVGYEQVAVNWGRKKSLETLARHVQLVTT